MCAVHGVAGRDIVVAVITVIEIRFIVSDDLVPHIFWCILFRGLLLSST